MVSLQALHTAFALNGRPDLDSPAKSTRFYRQFATGASRNRIMGFRISPSTKFSIRRGLRVRCSLEDDDDQGEEPPESLFMKELRRRGISPTSLLEENRDVSEIDKQIYLNEEEREILRRNAVSTDTEKDTLNQRERSMALNSEGIEGLIPRAKILLAIGGTFFLAFGPLILTTFAIFSALYFFFGATFVHDASKMPLATPQNVDPYALLDDVRLS